jgi:5-hydroxyisourate hydrolase-like protein (transthyretin family)
VRRRLSDVPKLLLLATLCAALAFAGIVEGTVVDAVTGVPLAGVRIDLLPANVYHATTDQQGHFVITNVKDGRYTARFVLADYMQSPLDFREFTVSGDAPVKLESRLTPLGKWSGRVIDADGKPVPKARVDLGGQQRLLRTVTTDEKGKFDLQRLPFIPGPFTLSALAPAGWKPAAEDRAWTRTWYPGDVSDVRDIEIKLLAMPTHTVRGILLSPDGKPAPDVAVAIGETLSQSLATVRTGPEGTFEFQGIVDGTWRLSATLVEKGDVKLRADRWLEIAGNPPRDLTLRLERPFALRGKIVGPGRISIRLEPIIHSRAPSMPETSVAARSAEDGSFTIEGLYPGDYRLVAIEPPNTYAESVRLGETLAAAPALAIASGAAALTLTYGANGGTVRGTVEHCDSHSVLLVPQDPSLRWPGFLRDAPCDSAGNFTFAAIRPGEYYALFFSGFRAPWFDPRFDATLPNLSTRVTVRPGETSTITVRAIDRPPF